MFTEILLQQLKRDAERSRQHAFALGTYKNLKCQWVKYLKFCAYFDLIAFPASTEMLAWYAQFLSRCLRAHAP